MYGINLVIESYCNDTRGRLCFRNSNGPNKITEIPGQLSNNTFLLKHCNKLILPEWQEAILDLYNQERACINKRKELMKYYKEQLKDPLDETISKFQIEHPEYFI